MNKETGKCLPDKAIMTDLCEILEITSNELLAGERIRDDNKEKINNLSVNLLNEKNKIKRLLIISISMIIVTIISFLLFYFFKTYKKVEIYSVAGVTENFDITDSLLTITPDEVYLNISVIKPQKDIIKIKEATLYYLKDNKVKTLEEKIKQKVNQEGFTYEIEEESGNEVYIKNYDKDIKIGDSVLFNGELECEGDCSRHEEKYKYYKEKYIDEITDFE